eukprot:2907697-Pyramimonas_sp.AAC.1
MREIRDTRIRASGDLQWGATWAETPIITTVASGARLMGMRVRTGDFCPILAVEEAVDPFQRGGKDP